MSSVSYVVALLGPAVASATMTALLWFPFWIGICLLIFAIPVILMLPEHTPASRHQRRHGGDQAQPLLSSPVLKAQRSDPSIWQSVLDRSETLRTILATHPRNLTLLFISFFLTSLASSDTKLLAQYISKRYLWTFASAGYLLSGKAIVNFVLLTVIIPNLLRTRHSSAHADSSAVSSGRANIRYANICLAISVVGALTIAIAAKIWMLVPSLFLYALGSALPVFTLSLLKSPAIALKHNDGLESAEPETHIFSLVMMIKTLGSLVGAPLMAILWVKGISTGGAAIGMPYFVSGACYMLALIVISSIKMT
jgi:hypothetical protein